MPTAGDSQPSPGTRSLSTIWHRFCALFVDGVVIGLPVVGGYLLMVGWPPPTPETLLESFLVGLALATPYFVYEAAMLQARGQTVGKIVMKIEVVRSDGAALSVWPAWLRSGLKILVFRGTLAFLLNALPAVFTKQKTALHDLVSDTRVRYRA